MESLAGRLVILGAGQAGAQLAFSARSEGFQGEIVLVGEEPCLPYRRPPLSKEYLAGGASPEQVFLRPEVFFAEQRIELRLGLEALSIDRARKQVSLSDGSVLGYDALGLTLGTRVRPLAVPGIERAGVHYLRTIADVAAIQNSLKAARSAVVVGGGFVGLEAAAVLRTLGLEVTVLELAERLLPRVVSPTLSEFYRGVHASRGVALHTNVRVTAIEAGGRAQHAVRCADGRAFEADFVVIGIGVLPNQELAQRAGLRCEDGIVVDAFARTCDPSIFAAGDCARHPNALLARESLRLESVHNAVAQATAAAQALSGKPTEYAQFPWFWSDQYEFKLQMVGLSTGADQEVLRGSVESGRFSLFHFRAGKWVAADTVNSPPEHILCKRLLAAGKSPTPEQARDLTFDLKSLLASG